MEIRVLQYFLTVVREESISRAAEALHITQPTLSRQLAQLEEERPEIAPQPSEVSDYVWIPGAECPALQERWSVEPFTTSSFALYGERILAGAAGRKK